MAVILVVAVYVASKMLSSSSDRTEATYTRSRVAENDDEDVRAHVGLRGKKVYAGTNWFNEELQGRVDDDGNLYDFVARDAANRELGRRGEEFVLEFERRRLHDGGRRDLVSRIEWTAQVRGDGAGYDVQSFGLDGSSRLIEVKTTGLGKYFPFNVTQNEVRCSEARPQEFRLYRVFNFGPEARLYMLPGELSKSCHLNPTQYRAFVQAPR